MSLNAALIVVVLAAAGVIAWGQLARRWRRQAAEEARVTAQKAEATMRAREALIYDRETAIQDREAPIVRTSENAPLRAPTSAPRRVRSLSGDDPTR